MNADPPAPRRPRYTIRGLMAVSAAVALALCFLREWPWLVVALAWLAVPAGVLFASAVVPLGLSRVPGRLAQGVAIGLNALAAILGLALFDYDHPVGGLFGPPIILVGWLGIIAVVAVAWDERRRRRESAPAEESEAIRFIDEPPP